MTAKTASGIELSHALGIENIFVNDWKKAFFSDPKKKIASVAFIRNIIEYTKGMDDPDFVRLTSLLHWKDDSTAITVADLDGIYARVFGGRKRSPNPDEIVVKLIQDQIPSCISDCSGLRFENKIVMAIAIRLAAEKYMIEQINDQAFTSNIKRNQTAELVEKFRQLFPGKTAENIIIERVALMTPENIHLNSFMYEPIVDMSDEHLRRLCQDVISLV